MEKQKQILLNQLVILSALASMVGSSAERETLLKEYLATEKIIERREDDQICIECKASIDCERLDYYGYREYCKWEN